MRAEIMLKNLETMFRLSNVSITAQKILQIKIKNEAKWISKSYNKRAVLHPQTKKQIFFA